MYKQKLLAIISLIFLIILDSIVIADNIIPAYVRGRDKETTYDFTFNFTSDNSCNNVLKSITTVVTTDINGIGFASLDISDLTTPPSYMCEYQDNVLIAVHIWNDIITNKIISNNISIGSAIFNDLAIINQSDDSDGLLIIGYDNVNVHNVKLHITSAGNTELISTTHFLLTTGKSLYLKLGDAAGGRAFFIKDSNSITKATLNSDGELRLGDANAPRHMLDVIGSIKATDYINTSRIAIGLNPPLAFLGVTGSIKGNDLLWIEEQIRAVGDFVFPPDATSDPPEAGSSYWDDESGELCIYSDDYGGNNWVCVTLS